MKREYTEGTKARGAFEAAMTELFKAPKQARRQKPPKAPRPCLRRVERVGILASEFAICGPLPGDLGHSKSEGSESVIGRLPSLRLL